jgi:hypothetical protein
MFNSSRARFTGCLLALVALVLVGCPDAPDNGETNERVIESSTADVDGLVLMHRAVDANTDAVNLIDPTTGKASPIELWHVDFALSLDARTIALVETDGAVQVARFVIDENDLPTFEFVARWEGAQETSIDATAEPGIWLGANAIYDTNSGEATPCKLAEVEDWSTVSARCAELRRRRFALTSDRQFGGPGLTHVPTGARLASEYIRLDGRELTGEGVQIRLPDGRVGAFPAGINGKYAQTRGSGFDLRYDVITSRDRPSVSRVMDLTDTFATGAVEWDVLRELTAGLSPEMSEGEGRGFEPITVLPSGELVYAIDSWKLVRTATADINSIHMQSVHAALVAIDEGGRARTLSWRDSEGEELPGFGRVSQDHRQTQLALRHHGALYMGDDNWLVPGGNWGWYGYIDGESTAISEAGRVSADGQWFVRQRPVEDAVPSLCFRPVEATAVRTCIPQPTVGAPITIVAQGIRKQDGRPVITTLSKPAVWPEGELTVFGARFGNAGTLLIDGEPVDEERVLAWSDSYVRLRVPEQLPTRSTVSIETTQGRTPNPRTLNRTELASTPLDGFDGGPHRIGQGLNRVDLGVTHVESSPGDNLRLSSDPVGDTTFLAYSDGAVGEYRLPVSSDKYEMAVEFVVEDRMADSQHWQPVELTGVNELRGNWGYFTYLADSMVEVPTRTHPIVVGQRVLLADIRARGSGVASSYGLPGYWRQKHEDDIAYVMPFGEQSFRVLEGYGEQDPQAWGLPRLADEPDLVLEQGALGFDAHGDSVLVVGNSYARPFSATFQFSRDGGRTLEDATLAQDALGRQDTSLVEPIAMHRAGEEVYLVFESGDGSSYHTHLVTDDGALEQDVADSPEITRPFRPATNGAVALVFAPEQQTVIRIDLSEGAPTWRAVPDEADRGRVASWFEDPSDGSVTLLLDDGTFSRAADDTWSDWQHLDLDVSAPVDLDVTPRTLGRLSDGRWIINADIGAPDGGDWEFGGAGLLVSPATDD